MMQTEKRHVWKTHYETWKDSGQSIAGWCRSQDINIHQMYYWVKRFETDVMPSKPGATEWLAVQVDDEMASSKDRDSIFIHLDAISVEVRPDADVDLLVDILEVLKQPC